MPAVSEYATVIMGMIRTDISKGMVPATVQSWDELHGHVDASGYTDLAGVPWGTDTGDLDDPYRTLNAVHAQVSRRLAAGEALCQRCGWYCSGPADCDINRDLAADGVSPSVYRNPLA